MVWLVRFGVQAHEGRISIAVVNRVDLGKWWGGGGGILVVCIDTPVFVGIICRVLLIRIGIERQKEEGGCY